MKKLFLLMSVLGFLIVNNPVVHAQDDEAAEVVTANDTTTEATEAAPQETAVEEEEEEATAPVVTPDNAPKEKGHQIIKKYFIQGGPSFMGIVLICLILGLAFAIERIITLNLATTNTKKLLTSVENELASGNIEGAKEICKSNRSPVASIFYQGLSRVNEGIEIVEKSILAYGSVQMGLLEKGLVWISLFIALAPMLGFMGTVIGMIDAFDAIEAAGDISPSLVAGGIKVALLTTVFGLIVAIILQLFYNYIVSKIDGIVNNMEDASISFVDLLVKHNVMASKKE